MPLRYYYEADGFVVDDSEVEYVTRKSKSKSAPREQKPLRAVESSNVAKKKKKSPCHNNALLQELADLAPFNAPPQISPGCQADTSDSEEDIPLASIRKMAPEMKTVSTKDHADTYESEDDVPLALIRKMALKVKPILKPTSSHPHTAKAIKKSHNTAKPHGISKKHKVSKKLKHRQSPQFEELASLMIEQKGYREWQHSLLSGSEEHQYSHAICASSSKQTKEMELLKLPGELRNRIYHALLEDEKEVTIKKQSSAEGSRRSARHGADKSRFQSYALAQTCCQLRSEYLPWLRENRRVRVDLMQMYDYLRVFHPATDTAEPNKRAAGHVQPIWHDFALPSKGIDVLLLAKIAHASPDLHLYLEPEEAEVRLPEYHELTTMKNIIQTYPQWQHIIDRTSLYAIRLTSHENKNSWYQYTRRIEMLCHRPAHGVVDQREELLGSWVFKTGMYMREDMWIDCAKTSQERFIWTPTDEDDDNSWVSFVVASPDNLEFDSEDYQMKVDMKSELGYQVVHHYDYAI